MKPIGIFVKCFSGIFVKKPSLLAVIRYGSFSEDHVITNTYNTAKPWYWNCLNERMPIDLIVVRMKRDR